jgi:chromosome segregation ATPase
MDEHANRFCGSGAFACAFAPYGCPFRGAREELTRHEAEDAHKHLHLCAVQIEQARGTYAEWAEEIQTVKRQFERAAKEGKERVERDIAERTASEARAEEEIEALRTALTELKAHYEEEAVRLRRKAERTAAEAEARVKDVEAENAALRNVLASKMPRAEAEAIERRFEDAFAKCEAELEDAKATVARHETRWGADVARVKADVDAARAKADAAHAELLARVAAHAESDAARCDAVERELHDANKEFIEDLDELARKQREFEERWTRANEKLRGARGVLVEKGGEGGGVGAANARGFLGDASSGPGPGPGRDAKPAAALPSSGKKARGDRARGAAALLFGRGSRADPGE